MPPIGVSCSTCPHYFPDEGTEHRGICRLNPPHPFLIPGPPNSLTPNQPNIRIQAIWPPVAANHYCGQHPMFSVAVPIDSRLAAPANGEA